MATKTDPLYAAAHRPNAIYNKLSLIMGDITTIEKDDQVRGSISYRYVSSDAVYERVRELLVKYHLALSVSMLDVQEEAVLISEDQKGIRTYKYRTLIQYEYTLLDGETGDTLPVSWWEVSEGRDDKGIRKASTLALKSWLLKLFVIPTSDEVDAPAAPPRARTPNKTKQPKSPGDGKAYTAPADLAPKAQWDPAKIWKDIGDDEKCTAVSILVEKGYDFGKYVWNPLLKATHVNGVQAMGLLGYQKPDEWEGDLRSLLLAIIGKLSDES